MKKQKIGFTLIEMVIITLILITLGIIGIISYTSSLSYVRDSNRISQITNIADALQIERSKGRKLPMPENNIRISLSGAILRYQGIIGQDNLNALNITKGGIDPKDKTYYTYTTSKNRGTFQLLTFLEEKNEDSSQYLFPLDTGSKYTDRYISSYGEKIGVFLYADSLIPINEDTDLVSQGYVDIATSTGYIIYISANEILSGTGVLTIDSEN